jgi:methylenetetrahydrofolate reductase (NADPH)
MAGREGTFSFEFFPPKTPEGIAKLRSARAQLAQLRPAFCSVTFGAGGSTREGTLETVREMLAEGLSSAPHISCIGGSRQSLRDVLSEYRSHGVDHLVALRGDLPSGSVDAGEFRYASDLVTFIREEAEDHFHVDVGVLPRIPPAGAQPAGRPRQFRAQGARRRRFRDHAILLQPRRLLELRRYVRGARHRDPIVPGIMPIHSAARLARFSDACGAEIPRWIRRRLEGFGDDTASIRAFGLDVVTDLCAELLDEGAPGLHFYTLIRRTHHHHLAEIGLVAPRGTAARMRVLLNEPRSGCDRRAIRSTRRAGIGRKLDRRVLRADLPPVEAVAALAVGEYFVIRTMLPATSAHHVT